MDNNTGEIFVGICGIVLLEVHAELVLDPGVGVWTLLAGVQIPLFPQLSGVQLAYLGNVTGHFFNRNRLKNRFY